MRRFLSSGLILAAVLLSPSAPAAPAADPYAGIRDLLARRVEAMLEGDEGAFLSTIQTSNEAFASRQRLLFRGFQELDLADYALELDLDEWPDLTTDRERARRGESAVVLHVDERYRIEGYDDQPALDDLFLTFARRGGEWKIVSDTDLDDLTLFTGRKLWEFGRIITRESEHFLFVAHPAQASAAAAVLESAERALEAVRAGWPLPWDERMVLLVPTSRGELSRVIQATFDLDVFVAFAYSTLDRARDWDLVGHRVILNWPTFSAYPDSVRQTILTHELLHAATREYAGPFTSVFVDEGVAELVAGNDGTSQVAERVSNGSFDEAFPRDFEFVTGSGDSILNAYQESFTAMDYAADQFGREAVARFYRSLGSARIAPGTSRYHVDRAARGAFGIGIDPLERHWSDWVEANL
jgi:hypothetical protein